MRKKNAILGTLFGILYQIVAIILTFAVRTIFIQNLSADYLGVNALFSDIFGILIALDCGISSSVFIRIYKPLADGETERVKSVFALIRLVYRIRALAVFVVGFAIYFFLPVLAKKTVIPLEYIQALYVVYLILCSLNYTVIFYTFFLDTVQKRYISVCIQMVVQIVQSVTSIVCLIVFKSFTIYMVINLLSEIAKSLVCRQYGMTKYPYLKGRLKIQDEDKKDFKSLIGMAFHSMSNVIVRYTDSLLITSFVGLSMNGIYSNYKMIVDKINSLINQMTMSIKDPMRNLMAEGDKEKVKGMVDRLSFLYFWICGFCSVSLICLLNPFITLCWGEEYVIGIVPIVLTVITMYLPILNYTINDAYYYSECYLNDKKTPILEIIINLSISFIFGRKIGLTGIILGTVVCYVFQTIRRASRLYSKYFKISVMGYVGHWLEYNVVILGSTVVTYYLIQAVKLNHLFGQFVLQVIICVLIPNVLFFLLYFHTKRFEYFKEMLLVLMRKITRKKTEEGK